MVLNQLVISLADSFSGLVPAGRGLTLLVPLLHDAYSSDDVGVHVPTAHQLSQALSRRRESLPPRLLQKHVGVSMLL